MKYLFFSIFALCATVQAENFAAASGPLPDAPNQSRPFWTTENKVDFGILGGLVVADAITTQRGLSEGFHETNPLMRPFVSRGAAGEAVGSHWVSPPDWEPCTFCTRPTTTKRSASRCA